MSTAREPKPDYFDAGTYREVGIRSSKVKSVKEIVAPCWIEYEMNLDSFRGTFKVIHEHIIERKGANLFTDTGRVIWFHDFKKTMKLIENPYEKI
jgi:hypothetical protein